ncbi:translation initiation factor IF-2 subunit gamma [Candidatus Woesearchaeota archaeon]|nr:MAG: translation initiation factor IF-2 subunit gamma [Candidatus Woesearchaeota archaeon]
MGKKKKKKEESIDEAKKVKKKIAKKLKSSGVVSSGKKGATKGEINAKTNAKTIAKPKKILQPEVNIGLVGHVDHGKTTLTERLSGKWTDTHSEEIKRGITIRLGYADTTFYKCPRCKEPECYCTNEKCPRCKSETEPLRMVSFVDAPGHESLMATMLSGATIMDGALLLIAANEQCPQPQTREHLMALEMANIKNVIVVQNKIDLVPEGGALKNYNQIKEFLKGTNYADAPIIPVSARHDINVDVLIKTVQEVIPTPKRDFTKKPLMLIARSFDINKPGTMPERLLGGILGGSLKQGVLKNGEAVELRPGHMVEERNQKIWKPIKTKILALRTGNKDVDEVTPGGSFAILTSLDPAVVKSDKLAGNVLSTEGNLPPVWDELKLRTYLLERVVGAREDLVVEPIKIGEPLMLNVNSAATVGVVKEIKKDVFKCVLKIPVCADKDDKVTISRRIGNRFRLIGYGVIVE